MIEMHKRRPYIENLRNDPRTRAMFNGWVAQATATADQRRCGDGSGFRQMAHDAAQQALALAMAFILDNDGEYQMVCEERDRLREHILSIANLTPPASFVAEKGLS